MLSTARGIVALAAGLSEYPSIQAALDPVLSSSSSRPLLEANAIGHHEA
ncbi:hypothetical protein ACWGS9_29100 [Bradyrhizobium sp. Arg314]